MIASGQHPQAQQRAVLLIRDVLAIPTADVAAMLDVTAAGIARIIVLAIPAWSRCSICH